MQNKRKIFENTDNTIKPIWLPQMKADKGYILKELDGMGVKYSIISRKPTELKPQQKSVNTETIDYFNNQINSKQPIDPIFVSQDDEVLDGHNRLFSYKSNPMIDNIVCIKIMLGLSDSARILNKIQDKFDWEKEMGDNGVMVKPPVAVNEPVIAEVKEEEAPVKNKKEIKLYRETPIKANSKTGNFFLEKKNDKYKLENTIIFENLYEISDEEISDGKNPIDYVLEKFGIDFNVMKEDSVKNGIKEDDYKLRKVCEMGKEKGYDGIKYGSKYIQAL